MHKHHHGPGDHHAHTHTHAQPTTLKIFAIAIGLIFGFAIIEALSGWRANSLALLSDSGHMASDGIALIIAAFAAWLSERPPTFKHSYGMGRAEVIAAWFTSLALIVLSAIIIGEAVARIHRPSPVHGGTVLVIAGLGLLVNGFVAWILSRGEKTLNLKAVLIHVFGDVLGSIAALIAGTVILKTHWYPIDPILSIFIGILIIISSFRIFREALHVLMEGVPKHISIDQVSEYLRQVSDVHAVHDLHIWTLSSGNTALSAHIQIKELKDWEPILDQLKKLLKEQFDIDHITLQPEAELNNCIACDGPSK